ncbi:TMEM175 family protein [Kitasatospora sp. NPDC059827]|uniref:TMEM175 family protein n=1 Tax=unclassified Kitasatospora TaxID=2633591 RepID=UPI003668E6E0
METRDTGRIEAFSDGVFAIAITLLVLEIKIPQAHGAAELWRALGAQWPSYFAYVVSFLVIGVVWVNHHTLFAHLARVDRTLMFLNLLLLMLISVLPFPTAVVAQNLRNGSAANVAAAVYGAVMVGQAVLFSAFWNHVTRTGRCFDEQVDVPAARAARWRFELGLVVYPLTVALAFLSAPAALAVHGLLAVYYGFNQVRVPLLAQGA